MTAMSITVTDNLSVLSETTSYTFDYNDRQSILTSQPITGTANIKQSSRQRLSVNVIRCQKWSVISFGFYCLIIIFSTGLFNVKPITVTTNLSGLSEATSQSFDYNDHQSIMTAMSITVTDNLSVLSETTSYTIECIRSCFGQP
jgi:hypothetical protein